MGIILYQSFFALCIFVTSVVGVLLAFRKYYQSNNGHHHASEAAASGIFLGAALFHIMPSALDGFVSANISNAFLIIASLILASFMLLLFLEFTLPAICGKGKNNGVIIAYILFASISIHAILEGMALGVNTALGTALIIFFAILVHKGSESFAVADSLLKRMGKSPGALGQVIAFCFMTPIGILLGTIITGIASDHHDMIIQGTFNSLAAGTFLYIALTHSSEWLYNGSHRIKPKNYISLLLGLILMGSLALWS